MTLYSVLYGPPLSVTVPATAPTTGIAAATALGVVAARGRGLIQETGFAAAKALGTDSATGRATIHETGAIATAALGSAAARGRATIAKLGFAAASAIGTDTATGRAVVVETGLAAPIALGTATADGGAGGTPGIAPVTGIAALSALGPSTATGAARTLASGFAVPAGFDSGAAPVPEVTPAITTYALFPHADTKRRRGIAFVHGVAARAALGIAPAHGGSRARPRAVEVSATLGSARGIGVEWLSDDELLELVLEVAA